MKKKLRFGLVILFFLINMSTAYGEESTSETSSGQSVSSFEGVSSTDESGPTDRDKESSDFTTIDSQTTEKTEEITTSTVETENSDNPKEIEDSEQTPTVEKKEIKQFISLAIDSPELFENEKLEEKTENSYMKGQTFFAKEELIYSDGKEYFTLYDSKDTLIGIISKNDVTNADNQGGVVQPFQKYATIKTDKGKLITDFEKNVSITTAKIVKQTYRVKGISYHFDGTKYYQLYDNTNKLLGFIKDSDVSLSDDACGVYQAINQYVTIPKNNYTIWQNFNWKKKYDSKKFVNRTFLVKGEYHHFNGDTYYSLYDSSDGWYGYINKNGVNQTSQAQGPYFSFGKYVTVKNSNQTAWNSFEWQKKQSLKNMSGKTYHASGVYHHVNGEDYYSLYDNTGKWQGYVNKEFVNVASGRQGSYQNFGKYVTVTNRYFSLWWNFSWNEKSTSDNLYLKTYQARGLYRHYNGQTYYSIFDNAGNWQGYINANGVAVAEGRQGIYQSYWKNVTVYKNNYDIYSDFSWTKRNRTNNYLNRTFKARGIYQHFNGSTYVSLYDNSGKWYGYVNKNATSESAEKIAKVQQLLNSKYNSSKYGIYVMSLSDGLSAEKNANSIFTAASTGKLPAMYYTQKRINQGSLDPNKLYLYTDAINQMGIYSYGRGGSGILQGKRFGTYYSLDTMLNWTAKYSDNQGANFLGYYGANRFDWSMRNEISNIIGRQWTSPFQVTAKENALMMNAIYKQGGQVLYYMQNTIYDNDRIPKYLPVKVAHKIGDVYNYRHDVGVVYADQPYIISVLTQNTSYETIARLSREVYDIMK